MMNAAIVKVLGVIDTRQYEEIGDRWIAIPGTGDSNQCARCGRDHEVHAEVELADGRRVLVGTGCASKESLEIATRVKEVVSLTRRLDKAARTLERAEAEFAAYQAARAEVRAMTPPATHYAMREFAYGSRLVANCGDAWVMVEVNRGEVVDHPGNVARAQDAWRRRQVEARGFTRPAYEPREGRTAVAKLQKALAALTS